LQTALSFSCSSSRDDTRGSNNNSNNNDDDERHDFALVHHHYHYISPEDAFDLVRFQRRREQLERNIQKPLQLPLSSHPSALDPPQQFVFRLLEELRAPSTTTPCETLPPSFATDLTTTTTTSTRRLTPHSGVIRLWHSSTVEWQQTMMTAAAAAGGGISMGGGHSNNKNRTETDDADNNNNIAVLALGEFLARPNQQFAILLGKEDRNYEIEFPTDVVECSDDGNNNNERELVWLECRLRSSTETNNNKNSMNGGGELLVVLGWTLCKVRKQGLPTLQPLLLRGGTFANEIENSDDDEQKNGWHVHSLDWQDFRDAYRPGIGREEWERICG